MSYAHWEILTRVTRIFKAWPSIPDPELESFFRFRGTKSVPFWDEVKLVQKPILQKIINQKWTQKFWI